MAVIKLKNARSWKPGGLRPTLVCAFGFALSFTLRYALGPYVGDSLSMAFFSINCIVMSYLFGYVYSLVLLAISIPTALFFFRAPLYTLEGFSRQDFFLVLIYTGIITLTSLMIEWLQRERYVAVLQQRVSETRYQLLIESDQARREEYMRHFVESDASAAQDDGTTEPERPGEMVDADDLTG